MASGTEFRSASFIPPTYEEEMEQLERNLVILKRRIAESLLEEQEETIEAKDGEEMPVWLL